MKFLMTGTSVMDEIGNAAEKTMELDCAVGSMKITFEE